MQRLGSIKRVGRSKRARVFKGKGKQGSATLTLRQGQDPHSKVNYMNLSQLPPQKKRVLAIGLVAFVVLLFVSFLLSLMEDDGSKSSIPEEPEVLEETSDGLQLKKPQVPTSQRYDFNQESEGNGLETLLEGDQEFGVTNNPFSNMQSQSSLEPPKYGPNTTNVTQEEAEGTITEELEMAKPEPVVKEFTLYCDSYGTAQEAESQKAMLAFQGISTTVVESGGTYRLKIGPYTSSDEAKASFNALGSKGLVKKCSLISN